jgi:phospholipid N-methyltransferase
MTDAVDRALGSRLANAWLSCAPWVFAREMLSQPAAVGAIWPSSCRLARSLASRVPLHGEGLVVELGGGTGAVTRALLQRGIAPGRLVVIERSAAFVRHLRARFPGTVVVQGDAAELEELLPPGSRIDAIVSSLPLRSLPAKKAAAVVAQWRALVADGGIVVQFTYDLGGSEYQPLQGFLQRWSHIVWANLPPARVQVLEYCRADGNPGLLAKRS